MRTIKFRCWDKKAKRMSDNFTLFDIYAGRDDSTIPDKDNMTFYFGNNELYDLELMQFTGLTDKHGVEIYEGDIVRVKYNLGSMEENRIDEVFWNEYQGGFALRDAPSGNLEIAKYIEVIGNVYENEDLLKVLK